MKSSKKKGSAWGGSASGKESDVWILGSVYRENKGSEIRKQSRSLFRITYRKDFPAMEPYSWLTSDAGWGCMIRSAQMMLATAFSRHWLGSGWRLSDDIAVRRSCVEYNNILTLFLDYPGDPACFYSIHNIVQCGIRHDKLPGEWFGPSTAALALRDLAKLHRRQYGGPIEILVANGDTIYTSEIEKICTALGVVSGAATSASAPESQPDDKSCSASDIRPPNVVVSTEATCTLGDDLASIKSEDSTKTTLPSTADSAISQPTQPKLPAVFKSKLDLQQEINDRIRSRAKANSASQTNQNPDLKWNPKLFFDPLYNIPPEEVKPWVCSIVVLVPLRLGIDAIDPSYLEELKEVLRNKYSIGFIGGRVNHAIYFAGYKGKSTLLGLDPHTTFPAISKPVGSSQFPYDEIISQIHMNSLEELDFSRLDPSLSLGFYFRSKDELDDFADQLKKDNSAKLNAGKTPIICVEYSAPSYISACDECEMEEAIDVNTDDDNLHIKKAESNNAKSHNKSASEDEDDEYVML